MKTLWFDKLRQQFGPPQASPKGIETREATAFRVYPSLSARSKKGPLAGPFLFLMDIPGHTNYHPTQKLR